MNKTNKHQGSDANQIAQLAMSNPYKSGTEDYKHYDRVLGFVDKMSAMDIDKHTHQFDSLLHSHMTPDTLKHHQKVSIICLYHDMLFHPESVYQVPEDLTTFQQIKKECENYTQQVFSYLATDFDEEAAISQFCDQS